MKNSAPFQYFESDDHDLFERYVELRQRAYSGKYSGLPADFGLPDEADHTSRIVYAVRQTADEGRVLAGGARLTISTPACPRRLPLEEKNFSLRSCALLKDLYLDRNAYGEISRMAAAPEHSRGFDLSFGLGNALCALAASEGLDVVFSMCPELPARVNERNAKRQGVRFHRYTEMAPVCGMRMWLCAFIGLLRVYGIAQREREVAC
jgi:hypothetical protein